MERDRISRMSALVASCLWPCILIFHPPQEAKGYSQTMRMELVHAIFNLWSAVQIGGGKNVWQLDHWPTAVRTTKLWHSSPGHAPTPQSAPTPSYKSLSPKANSSQVKESRAWHKCLTTKLQFNCPAKAEQKQCLFFLHCSWLVEMTSDAGGRRIAKIKCDPNNLADRLVKRAVPTKRQKISWKIKTKGFSVVEKTEHWKDEYNNAKTNYEVNKARYMSPYKAPRYSVPRLTGN